MSKELFEKCGSSRQYDRSCERSREVIEKNKRIEAINEGLTKSMKRSQLWREYSARA